MRDNPNAATGLAILLTAAIIGGAYYLLVMRQPAPAPPEPSPKAPTTWQTLAPRPEQVGTEASDAPRIPREISRGRTDTPIKCFDPKVDEFWTNATTCEGADLNNRLSYPGAQAAASGTAEKSATTSSSTRQGSSTPGVRADRAKLMGQDYVPPEEAAVKSQSDKDN